jgi:NAD(P)-dependent dehydrogenase (short-subunit alcohol dehydrogenase family)
MGYLSFIYRQAFVHPPQIPSNVSLRDQTVLITGSNSGIGLEAARQCVKLSAEVVILAVRTTSKGEAAKADILASNPSSNSQVEIWQLDMESFDSVLAFGERAQSLPRLDIALLNAGIFKFEWTTSPSSGIESSLQVNHICTALLSLLILPVLRKTSKDLRRPSRLTFTSSEVHMVCRFSEFQRFPNISA